MATPAGFEPATIGLEGRIGDCLMQSEFVQLDIGISKNPTKTVPSRARMPI